MCRVTSRPLRRTKRPRPRPLADEADKQEKVFSKPALVALQHPGRPQLRDQLQLFQHVILELILNKWPF